MQIRRLPRILGRALRPVARPAQCPDHGEAPDLDRLASQGLQALPDLVSGSPLLSTREPCAGPLSRRNGLVLRPHNQTSVRPRKDHHCPIPPGRIDCVPHRLLVERFSCRGDVHLLVSSSACDPGAEEFDRIDSRVPVSIGCPHSLISVRSHRNYGNLGSHLAHQASGGAIIRPVVAHLVVPPQNLVCGTIVDVCVLGVKLAIALRTRSRGATNPSIEGWNRSRFTRVSQSRLDVSPAQPAHRQRAKQDRAAWRDALATSAGPSMTGKRSDRRNASVAPNRAAGVSASARGHANSTSPT